MKKDAEFKFVPGGNYLTRDAYARLIQENIEWLEAQPRTLEREHILLMLRNTVGEQYPHRTWTKPIPPTSFYTASKTKHAPKWRALRDAGVPIVSTWIDEAGEGETSDYSDLWERCIREAVSAAVCIVYREEEETLKGALVEMGAALAAGREVRWIGPPVSMSLMHHPLIRTFDSIESAIAAPTHALMSCPAGRWPSRPMVGWPMCKEALHFWDAVNKFADTTGIARQEAVADVERTLMDVVCASRREGAPEGWEMWAELFQAADAVLRLVIDEPLYELPAFAALAKAITRLEAAGYKTDRAEKDDGEETPEFTAAWLAGDQRAAAEYEQKCTDGGNVSPPPTAKGDLYFVRDLPAPPGEARWEFTPVQKDFTHQDGQHLPEHWHSSYPPETTVLDLVLLAIRHLGEADLPKAAVEPQAYDRHARAITACGSALDDAKRALEAIGREMVKLK